MLLDFLPLLGAAAQKLLDLIPDPGARAEADQREINRAEAASPSLFVAGWRPAIGWVCAAALAFQYLARPLWVWASAVWWPSAPAPPALDEMLWQLMFGMLGMGSLRTIEKMGGGKGRGAGR